MAHICHLQDQICLLLTADSLLQVICPKYACDRLLTFALQLTVIFSLKRFDDVFYLELK